MLSPLDIPTTGGVRVRRKCPIVLARRLDELTDVIREDGTKAVAAGDIMLTYPSGRLEVVTAEAFSRNYERVL